MTTTLGIETAGLPVVVPAPEVPIDIPKTSSVVIAENGAIDVTLGGLPENQYCICGHLDKTGTVAVFSEIYVVPNLAARGIGTKILEMLFSACSGRELRFLDIICKTAGSLDTRVQVFGHEAIRLHRFKDGDTMVRMRQGFTIGQAREFLDESPDRSLYVRVQL